MLFTVDQNAPMDMRYNFEACSAGRRGMINHGRNWETGQ